MTAESNDIAPLRVAIVGGGIAALETVLALHDLAAARLRVTLLAPEPDFVLRPLGVAVAFNRGHLDRLALSQVMSEHGGRFVRGTVLRVAPDTRTVTLTSGEELGYDALVLAHGAAAVPAFEHALTFGADPAAMTAVLARLEQAVAGSVAFVVPPACAWSLPLYELALMTARDLWAMNADGVDVHLVTPELEPLEVFGPEAGHALTELLTEAAISLHCGVQARIPRAGQVEIGGGVSLAVDEVVALAGHEGRRLDGIPANGDGFIAVDEHGLVGGLDGVYAIGDATDRPIKQGGLACQQADAAAAHIAARAGAPIDVPPLRQELHGRLLTGTDERFLRREPGDPGEAVIEEPPSWSPAKVSGRYLAPYLVARGLVHLPLRAGRPAPGIELDVKLNCRQRTAELLGLSPLGPTTWLP